MSDVEALDHLDKAISHILKAREEAQGDVAAKELRNLYRSAEDCKCGLESDLVIDIEEDLAEG